MKQSGETERREEGKREGGRGTREGEGWRKGRGKEEKKRGKEELNWVKVKGVKLQVGAHHTEFLAVV